MVRASGGTVGALLCVIALAIAPAAEAAAKAESATSQGANTGSSAKKSPSGAGKASTPATGKPGATASPPKATPKSATTGKTTATKSTAATAGKPAAATKSGQAAKTAKKQPEPGQKSLGTFGAWWAYSEGAGDNRVCYAGSRPSKKEGKVPGRRDAYLLVTNRPGQKAAGEISLSSGYPFKDGSDAVASVGDKKFKMFTRGDNAWTYDAQADKAMLGALKSGKQIVVKGTAKTGQLTTDTYSLGGFPKALAAIDKACGG